jgi:LPS export ABC transporter protein LptC
MSFLPRDTRMIMLLLLLAGTTWLLQSGRDSKSDRAADVAIFSGGIDYYLNDVTFSTLGADGKPLYKLHAVTARHRQSDDAIEMSEIKLDFFRSNSSGSITPNDSWQLQAGKGEVSGDQSQVLLTGDVVARRQHAVIPAEIHTSAMLIEPRKNILVSQAPVLIRQGQHTVTAQTMTVELDRSRVILSDGVKGRYVP